MKPNPDSILPAPKITLYPAEHVELGWRGTHCVGAGMINAGNTCYLNSTLQVCLRNSRLAHGLAHASMVDTEYCGGKPTAIIIDFLQYFIQQSAYMWIKLLELFILKLDVVDENSNSMEETLP